MLYNVDMENEKEKLLGMINSFAVENGGNDLAAPLIGISPELLRAMRAGSRRISEKTAAKFGFDRVEIYVQRIQPAPQADAQRVDAA